MRKTYAVGTVRSNRKYMPKDLQVKGRGSVDSRSTSTGMMAIPVDGQEASDNVVHNPHQ